MHMIDGTYSVELRRNDRGSILRRFGKMKLKMDGTQLKGSMLPTFFWLDSYFRGGTVEGNRFTFTVYYSTPCQQWQSTVTGTVDGDRITGSASTPMGDYELTGVRDPHA